MTSSRKVLVVLAVLLSLSGKTYAGNPVGFDFLRTLVGARPAAMAGAFVAMPGDIHDLVYNPAGLSWLHKRHGTATYLNHLLDFQSGFLAYAHPFKKETVAAGFQFFDFGQFVGKDENNVETGEFGANSLIFSVAYSRSVLKNLSLGASGKFIRFQIDSFSETALAADFGALFSVPSENLNVGVAVFNVGSTTSAFLTTKDDLPVNVQVGVSKQLEHLPLLVSGALVKFRDESLDFRIGGEFTLTEQLFFRLGYNSVGQDQKVNTDKDKLAGVSFGLGFKLNTFNIDYSFSSFGEVGSLNRISLVGRF